MKEFSTQAQYGWRTPVISPENNPISLQSVQAKDSKSLVLNKFRLMQSNSHCHQHVSLLQDTQREPCQDPRSDQEHSLNASNFDSEMTLIPAEQDSRHK